MANININDYVNPDNIYIETGTTADGKKKVISLPKYLKRHKKNVMTARLSNTYTVNSTSANAVYKLDLVEYSKVGTKLSISDGGIKIGKGVSKILVSAQVYFTGGNNEGNPFIFKNNEGIIITMSPVKGAYKSSNITPTLIDVTENDIIYLKIYTDSNGGKLVVAGHDTRPDTSLTVEIVG